MNQHIGRWAFVAALAGFLFGFDTAVISGADQPLQALWDRGGLFHGLFVMSSALWGTVLGALIANRPCERFGRKRTLVSIGVLYLASALGSALAPDPFTFSAMRFVGGLGVGISSIVAPAYISEIAPPAFRGRLVALYQFQIVFGILVAYLSNFVLADWFGLGWRSMLGIEALPALIYLLLVKGVPESPRWLLLARRDEHACREVLTRAGSPDPDRLIGEIRASAAQEGAEPLFSRRYARPVLLAFLIAMFNQLSGINFVIYFAPRIFELAGLSGSAALLSTTGIGLVNLFMTVVGMVLIDLSGRRRLMLIGSLGYIVSLAAVAWAFQSGASGLVVVFFVFVFIASHAVGQGAVIWVFIAEIFPNNVRTKGQSLGAGTHWVFAALITLLMPYLLGRFDGGTIFAFFTAMMCLQLAFVLFLMPETKGKSLEFLAEHLSAHEHSSFDALAE